MRQNTREKILKVFFEHPSENFTVRSLAKKAKIPRATAGKYLIQFKKDGLITKDNAAADSLLFKSKKILYFLDGIFSSGLVEFLVNEMTPSCIILYGSIRKGDSESNSDIDLFIESYSKEIPDLAHFERKLGHPIQVFVESRLSNLNDNLFNNVVNGIKLYGVFKAR